MKKFFASILVAVFSLAFSSGVFAEATAVGASDEDDGSPVYTARSTGQMWMLEGEACRFVGMKQVKGKGDRKMAGTYARLDCRELKESGFFVFPGDVPDERLVMITEPAFLRVINAFRDDPRKSIWVSTLSSWWTPDRQESTYAALIVQVLEGDDTPYQQIRPEAQRLIVGQETLLINPDPMYTQLWEGMSQCGYPSPNFMVLLRNEEDYPALVALIEMFARRHNVPDVYVSGCDASGLYNFVHPGDGTS